jgi:hypothetical protein
MHQQTLTQMAFVPPSSTRDGNRALDLDADSDDVDEPIINNETKTMAKKEENTTTRKKAAGGDGKRRRKTVGDEADSDMDDIAKSRHHTQTITQVLKDHREKKEKREKMQRAEIIVIEDSEAEDDSDLDTDLEIDETLDMTGTDPTASGIEPNKEDSVVGEVNSAKRLKGEPDPHTPSSKRQCLEVPSSVPSVGSPLTPMLKRYSPLQTKPSPLKYKSPNVASTPARAVDLKGLPAGLKPKIESSALKPRMTLGVKKSPAKKAKRVQLEIPDSEDEGDLDSDDEIVGEDLAALEARVLGPPKKPTNGEFVLHKDHSDHSDIANDDDQEPEQGSGTAAEDNGSETESSVEPGDENKENLDENTHAHETFYHAGFETQAILDQVLSRSERERTDMSSTRPSETTQFSQRVLSSATDLTIMPASTVQQYAWARRRAKHPPPPEFQTQFESQRVPLNTIQGMKPPNRRSDLWVAMKPETVAQVVCGARTHDFRSWLNPEVRRFWIFESRPTCQLRYMADVGPRQQPGDLDERGLGNKEFNAHKSAPYAHELVQVYELNDPVSLQHMIDCGWVDAAPERQNEFVPPAIVAQLLANLRWALFAEGDDEEEEEEEDEEDVASVAGENVIPSSPPIMAHTHPATQQLQRETRLAGSTVRAQAKGSGPRRVLGDLSTESSLDSILSAVNQRSGMGPMSPRPPAAAGLRRPTFPPPRTPTTKGRQRPATNTSRAADHDVRTPLQPTPRQSQISTSSGGSTQRTPAIRRLVENDDDDDVEIPSPTPRRPRRPAHDSSNLTALLRNSNSTLTSTSNLHEAVVVASSDPVIGESPRTGPASTAGILSSSQRLPDSLVREDGRKPPMVIWDSQEEDNGDDDDDDEL